MNWLTKSLSGLLGVLMITSCTTDTAPRVQSLDDAVFAVSLDQGSVAYFKERKRGAYVLLFNEQMAAKIFAFDYTGPEPIHWFDSGLAVLGSTQDYLISDKIQTFPRPSQNTGIPSTVFAAAAKPGESLRLFYPGQLDSLAVTTTPNGTSWEKIPGSIHSTTICESDTFALQDISTPARDGVQWHKEWRQLTHDGTIQIGSPIQYTEPVPLDLPASELPQPCFDDTAHFVFMAQATDGDKTKEATQSQPRDHYLLNWQVRTGKQQFIQLRNPNKTPWQNTTSALQLLGDASGNLTLWNGTDRIWSVTKTGVVTDLAKLELPEPATGRIKAHVTNDYLLLAINYHGPNDTTGLVIAGYDRNDNYRLIKTWRPKPGEVDRQLKVASMGGFTVKPGAETQLMKK